jgi:hypothetical protein
MLKALTYNSNIIMTKLIAKNAEKIGKRTRGYRLKPATHALIVKIQKLLKSDQDAAIGGACIMFFAELKKNIPIRRKKC